jgi:hypothetical protein
MVGGPAGVAAAARGVHVGRAEAPKGKPRRGGPNATPVTADGGAGAGAAAGSTSAGLSAPRAGLAAATPGDGSAGGVCAWGRFGGRAERVSAVARAGGAAAGTGAAAGAGDNRSHTIASAGAGATRGGGVGTARHHSSASTACAARLKASGQPAGRRRVDMPRGADGQYFTSPWITRGAAVTSGLVPM